MRLNLSLRVESNSLLPFNYQYPLSGAIYKILSQSSPEYSEFLHNKGYLGPDGKLRKLFTFSKLLIQGHYDARNNPRGIPLTTNNTLTLLISSPILDEFIQHLVIGLFSNQKMQIATDNQIVNLQVQSVEALAVPEFTDKCRFIALSPIVLTTANRTTEEMQTYYYRPFDDGLSEAVRLSLIKKHETIYNKSPQNDQLLFAVDKEYIDRKGGEDKVSKLIHLRMGHDDVTKIKSFICPFTLTGSPELMRTAWECGIGDKTSMGFGCIEVGEKHNN